MHTCFGLVAVLATGCLQGADPAAVAALLKHPADAKAFPEASAIVLLDEKVVTLHADGTTTTEGHRLIRILQDRAIRQLSDQKVAFRGASQTCEVLTAVTHLPSGETRAPEANGIMEVSDPEAANAPFYSTARLKVVSFPGVGQGSVLELKYIVKPKPGNHDAKEEGYFSNEMQFGGGEPIVEKRLELCVPARTTLRYKMFNSDAVPSVRKTDATVRYTWDLKDQPQIIRESRTVPTGELVPRLVWTDAPDEKQLGRWLAGKFEAAAKPEATVRAKAKDLTAAFAGAEAKVERLALFVTKDIQTVPLQLGKVGFQPTPAATILANRYADTRDKFTLFKAMAQSIGLQAQPVFVHEARTKMAELPCLAQYQDILTRVTLPSGAIRYFNLNNNRTRLGALMPEDAGRPGLLVRSSGGEILTTPGTDERDNRLHATWTLVLDAEGNLSGQAVLGFDGLFDTQARAMLFEKNDEERVIFFRSIVNGMKTGARLEHLDVSDVVDLTKPVQAKLEVRFPGFACRQGDMMILNLPENLTPMGYLPFWATLPKVNYPCLVDATFASETSLDLQLPAGYRVAYQPATSKVAKFTFQHTLTSGQAGETISLKKETVWKEGVLTPSEYGSVWELQGQAMAPSNGIILLEKVN